MRVFPIIQRNKSVLLWEEMTVVIVFKAKTEALIVLIIDESCKDRFCYFLSILLYI